MNFLNGIPQARQALVGILYLTLTSLPAFADQTDSKIQEGLNQYHEGLFPEAEKSFSDALSSRSDDPRLDYNLGNSLYKQGKYQDALQDFTQAALENSDANLKKNSLYNSGNALFKMGKLQEAEAVYKKVLTLDPGDMDAKFNLEFVRQQLKKEEEQKQEPKKDDSKDQKSDKNDSSQQSSDNKEENKEQDSKQTEPPSPENESAQNEENNQSGSDQEQNKSSKDELNQEEAEQLLGNLSEDLKKISRMQAGKTKPAQSYQGNDW